MLSLQSLLDENPLRNEPGYETHKGPQNEVYNMVVEHDMIKQGYLSVFQEIRGKGQEETSGIFPFMLFKDVLEAHFAKTWETMGLRVNSLLETYPNKMECKVGVYRMTEHIDYVKLKEMYRKMTERAGEGAEM